jgi:hypothetical protein
VFAVFNATLSLSALLPRIRNEAVRDFKAGMGSANPFFALSK